MAGTISRTPRPGIFTLGLRRPSCPSAQLAWAPQNKRQLSVACLLPVNTAREEGLSGRVVMVTREGKDPIWGDRKEHKLTEKLDSVEVSHPRAKPMSVKTTRGEKLRSPEMSRRLSLLDNI